MHSFHEPLAVPVDGGLTVVVRPVDGFTDVGPLESPVVPTVRLSTPDPVEDREDVEVVDEDDPPDDESPTAVILLSLSLLLSR